MSCPFCDIEQSRLFYEDELVVGIWDGYPVQNWHALLIPRGHVPDWFAASAEVQVALMRATEQAKREIERRYPPGQPPAGYNIGINVGPAAGQTVPHLHVHVIPRLVGDCSDPIGGVRNVIPGQGNYRTGGYQVPPRVEPWVMREGARLANTVYAKAQQGPSSGAGYCVTQTESAGASTASGMIGARLGKRLVQHLERAKQVDIAVAFVSISGVQLLAEALKTLLRKDSIRVRVLTGDYRDFSDPRALRMLLNLLSGASAVGRDVQVRVFETKGVRSFHPKSYIFSTAAADAPSAGVSVAYVGSSNLTATALNSDGIEWNVAVTGEQAVALRQDFEELLAHPSVVALNSAWIANYEARRQLPKEALLIGDELVPVDAQENYVPPTPRGIQKDALQALQATRAQGKKAGLVVLATGLGKTYLAAFDASSFERVLFIAHRTEILDQARETFQRVHPDASTGTIAGSQRDEGCRFTFAMVQTLVNNLDSLAPHAFDYVVVDEFHHATASSYRAIIEHLQPAFLLGLTATPDRMDGANVLELCQENEVFAAGISHGILEGSLCPFHYWGIPDHTDLSAAWQRGQFRPDALSALVSVQRRARHAFEQWQLHQGPLGRTLGFCVDTHHADFMAQCFSSWGVRSASVHSGETSYPRSAALEELREGKLSVIFSVDMFNEGLDVPNVDTVLMLRPTGSTVVWLQQLGRGLRAAHGKTALQVIDFIGNHKGFRANLEALAQALGRELPRGEGRRDALRSFVLELVAGAPPTDVGCRVDFLLQEQDMQEILAVARKTSVHQAFLHWLQEQQEKNEGARPSATEAFHAGFSPNALRSRDKSKRSWFALLSEAGVLSEQEQVLLRSARLVAFLEEVQTTAMTRSYKMLLLQAWLRSGLFPYAISLQRLLPHLQQLAQSNPRLEADISVPVGNTDDFERLMREMPLKYLLDKDNPISRLLRFADDQLSFVDDAELPEHPIIVPMLAELVQYRLAEYLAREVGAK